MDKNRALKLSAFLIGIALPIVGMLIWSSKKRSADERHDKEHDDEAQLAAVADSFPASDPPASW